MNFFCVDKPRNKFMSNPIEYSLNLIQPVLETAAQLTKVRLSIAEPVSYSFITIQISLPQFCVLYLRNNGLNEACRKCDLEHMKQAETDGTITYKCNPLNLTEFIVPLKVKEQTRLFIFGGAIRTEDVTEEEILEKSKKIRPDLDEKFLLDEIKRCIPVLSEDEIKEATRIVETFCPLIEELLESRVIRVEQNALRAITAITGDMKIFQEPNDLLIAVAKTVSDVTNSDACSIWEADYEKNGVLNLAAYNIPESVVRNMVMSLDHSITGKVIKTGNSERILDISCADEADHDVGKLLVNS